MSELKLYRLPEVYEICQKYLSSGEERTQSDTNNLIYSLSYHMMKMDETITFVNRGEYDRSLKEFQKYEDSLHERQTY